MEGAHRGLGQTVVSPLWKMQKVRGQGEMCLSIQTVYHLPGTALGPRVSLPPGTYSNEDQRRIEEMEKSISLPETEEMSTTPG